LAAPSTPTTVSVSVAATDTNGCMSSATRTVSFKKCIDGINEFTAGRLNVSVYPNPAKESFAISIDGQTFFDLTIYDELGKLVFLRKHQTSGDVVEPGLAKGFYTIIVVADDISYPGKLLIQ
jgi:hypothetical protein